MVDVEGVIIVRRVSTTFERGWLHKTTTKNPASTSFLPRCFIHDILIFMVSVKH